MRYSFLPEALIELAPNKGFVIDGEYELKNVTWNENVTTSDIPKDEDIIKKCEELQADYDAKQYQRDRAPSYPEIKEQLDLLYHDMTSGKGDKTGEWYKAVNKIKTDNPKPE